MSEALLLPPSDLDVHPLLARVGMLDISLEHATRAARAAGKDRGKYQAIAEDLQETLDALKQSIAEDGILEPLKVCQGAQLGRYYVVDGRHRLIAATGAGLQEVPCVEVPPEKAAAVILGSIVRRQLSKGAIAYTAILVEGPEIQGHGGVRKASSRNELDPDGGLRGLAKRAGVSLGLTQAASQIYRLFEEYPSLRKRHEPSIWLGAGLNSLLGQLKVEVRNEGPMGTPDSSPSRRIRLALHRYVQGTLDLFGDWTKLDDEDRELAVDDLSRLIEGLPSDIQETLKTRLS